MNLFEATLQNVDNALNSFVNSFSAQIISEISPLVRVGLILYFIFVGVRYMRGEVDDTLSDIIWHILRVGVIVNIALTAGTYQQYVIQSVMGLPDDLVASLVSGSLPNATSGSAMATVLDTMWTDGVDKASLFFEQGSMGITDINLMPYINGVLVLVAVIFCIAIACFWLFATKILLALLLAVGSIFIIALVWQRTQHLFGSWLNTILALVLINIFICGCFGIFGSVFDSVLSGINPDAVDSNQIAGTASLLMLGILTCGVLLLIPTFALQLTGGAMSAGGMMGASAGVAGASAGAVAGATSAGARGAVSGAKGVASNASQGLANARSQQTAINRGASGANYFGNLYKK